MIAVLGISKKDIDLACLWLRWTSYLAEQVEGDSRFDILVLACVRGLKGPQKAMLKRCARRGPGMFIVDLHTLPDENEAGYPISANHLFLRSLEHCEQTYHGEDVLWIEPDAVPVRPGWFQAIRKEYNEQPWPFMGHLEPEHYTPHLAGVAVYPWDWRSRSPRLAGALDAPDVRTFGPGKGQPFDTYAGPEVIQHAGPSKTIQQVWQCPPFTAERLNVIRPETALFHQCKTGRLIETLARERFPAFL